MDTEIAQALYEKAAVELAVSCMEKLRPDDLIPLIESEAIDLLSQIKTILETDTMEDPECFRRIDEIVCAFWRKGIYTPRHDL